MYSLWMTGGRITRQSHHRADRPRHYLITGPKWDGHVPPGMTHIKSPTRYMVILGRTYADGTEGLSQSSTRGRTSTSSTRSAHAASPTLCGAAVDPNPGFSMTDKPQQVIDAMDTSTYFNMMARLMGDAPPLAPADAPIVAAWPRSASFQVRSSTLPSSIPADQVALEGCA